VASLSQGRTAAAQCGLFTHKSVPVIFEPPCTYRLTAVTILGRTTVASRSGKVASTNVSPDRSLLTPVLKSRIPGEVMAFVTTQPGFIIKSILAF